MRVCRAGGLTDESHEEVETVESHLGTPKKSGIIAFPSPNQQSDIEIMRDLVSRTSSVLDKLPRQLSRGRRGRYSTGSLHSRGLKSSVSDVRPMEIMSSVPQRMNIANEIQIEDQKRRRELDDMVKKSIKARSVDVNSMTLNSRKMEVYTETKEMDEIIKRVRADSDYSKKKNLVVHMESSSVLISKYKSCVEREQQQLE